MQRTTRYALMVAECLLDESVDPAFFPKQEWDPPFSKTARYEPDEMELKRQAYTKSKKAKK